MSPREAHFLFYFRSAIFPIIVLASATALGQGALPGIQPFSTNVGGPYDSVDLSTGNILLRIPVRTKAGKLPFSYALVGNSAAYNLSGTWMSEFSLQGQPMLADFGSTIGGTSSSVSCGTKWTNIYVIDPTGASHPFPSYYQSGSGTCYAGYNQVSSDGSGFTLVIPASSSSHTSLSGYGYSLYDKSGNKASLSSNTITVTDPDGATMTSVASGGTTTYTDTLNVSALSTAWTGGSSGDTYTYTDSSGGNQTFSVAYTWFANLQTNFGCGAPADRATSAYLPTSITTPAGNFTISYEQTPSKPAGYVTGRLASITYPSGGSVSFAYSGGNNGINCTSGVVPTLTRTVNDNNGNISTWTYVNNNASATPGNFRVTETDPAVDTILHYFSGEYEVARTVTDASLGLLSTTITCYNGNFTTCPAPGSVPTLPISRTTTYISYNTSATASGVDSSFDPTYGRLTDVYTYDSLTTPPTAAPSGSYALYRGLAYGSWNGSGCSPISGTYIQNALCYERDSVTTTPYRATYITRDAYGHPNTVQNWVTGSTYLNSTLTYSGGVLTSITEPNGALTQFSNFTCNGIFPQTITYPLSSVGSSSLTWDCNGGVVKSQTGVNGDVTSVAYGDPLWRMTTLTPPSIGSTTTNTYNTGSSLPWNVSSTSVIDSSNTFASERVLDGLGRPVTAETTSDPAGVDYTAAAYDNMGRVISASNPYRAGDTIYNTAFTYDALGRTLTRTNPDGTIAKWTYKNRSVKFVDENYKTKIFQYDGEGDLLSVCEVTSVSQMGGGSPSACSGDFAANGLAPSTLTIRLAVLPRSVSRA